MSPPVFTIEDFKRTFKIGHTKVFEEIKTGRLQTYNVGRRRFISGRAADDWQRKAEQNTAAAGFTGADHAKA